MSWPADTITDEPFTCPACNLKIPGFLPGGKVVPPHDDHAGNDCVLSYVDARCACACGCAALVVLSYATPPSVLCSACLEAAKAKRDPHWFKDEPAKVTRGPVQYGTLIHSFEEMAATFGKGTPSPVAALEGGGGGQGSPLGAETQPRGPEGPSPCGTCDGAGCPVCQPVPEPACMDCGKAPCGCREIELPAQDAPSHASKGEEGTRGVARGPEEEAH